MYLAVMHAVMHVCRMHAVMHAVLLVSCGDANVQGSKVGERDLLMTS
jgi:hypothetical protein